MRGELRALLGLLGLLACGSETSSDGAAYPSALAESASYEAAVVYCGQIEAIDLRGDCQVAVMEKWNRLDPQDCEALESELWKHECLFQLGERQWQAGDVETGLHTCQQTRFRRNCGWHLVQYEVLDTLDLPAAEAEAQIRGFEDFEPMPDAALQFWIIRFRELAGEGRPPNEVDCGGLQNPEPCRAAIQRHVISTLQTQARRHHDELCAAAPGTRVTLRGEPAWTPGPVVEEAEDQWFSSRCLQVPKAEN